jgi:hypothetical protein
MSESLTPERLAEIAARAAAATPGPWWTDTLTEHSGGESVGVDAEGDSWVIPCQDIDRADAEFVAHARTDVPALLTRVAELEASLREACDRIAAQESDLSGATARVAALETGYVAPSPSCTRCYGADAVRFVAQGGATAVCPVCETDRPESDDKVARSADKLTQMLAPAQALRDGESPPSSSLAALRQAALHDLPPGTRWRVIFTDSESLTGVAPVCTAEQRDLHTIPDYPGGPIRDEDGVYDCCPWPQFETYSTAMAAYLVALLNADGAS